MASKKKVARRSRPNQGSPEQGSPDVPKAPILSMNNIDDADRPHLIKYCRDVMGINPQNMPDNVLKGRIKAFMGLGQGTAASGELVDLTRADWDKLDTAIIIIAPSSEPHERGKHANYAVWVDFNGHQVWIPRNKPCRVPRGVVEILANAIKFDIDPETKERVYTSPFPYTVVSDEAAQEFERHRERDSAR